MTKSDLLESFNVRPTQIESLLKNLEVDGAIERVGSRWLRTLRDWSYDHERVESVTALRIAEQEEMLEYVATDGCRMHLLGSYLDDQTSEPCGICDNCSGSGFEVPLDPGTVQRAVDHLRRGERIIEPRQRLPVGGIIPLDRRHEQGRSLSVWGDGGWGNLVRAGKQEAGRFDDQLVSAAADLIRNRWDPEPSPTWVTFVPSRQNPGLVADFAARLAASLGLPCEDVVAKIRRHRATEDDAEQFPAVPQCPERLRGPRGRPCPSRSCSWTTSSTPGGRWPLSAWSFGRPAPARCSRSPSPTQPGGRCSESRRPSLAIVRLAPADTGRGSR